MNRNNSRSIRSISQTEIDKLESIQQSYVRAVLSENENYQNAFIASSVVLTGTINRDGIFMPLQAAAFSNIMT